MHGSLSPYEHDREETQDKCCRWQWHFIHSFTSSSIHSTNDTYCEPYKYQACYHQKREIHGEWKFTTIITFVYLIDFIVLLGENGIKIIDCNKTKSCGEFQGEANGSVRAHGRGIWLLRRRVSWDLKDRSGSSRTWGGDEVLSSGLTVSCPSPSAQPWCGAIKKFKIHFGKQNTHISHLNKSNIFCCMWTRSMECHVKQRLPGEMSVVQDKMSGQMSTFC